MALLLLENALSEVYGKIEQLKFHEIIRDCGDAIGLKQYRAAEHAKMPHQRYKNIATGYFRDMITRKEMRNLCALYDLPYDILVKKAQDYVEEIALKRKIRTLKYDKKNL